MDTATITDLTTNLTAVHITAIVVITTSRAIMGVTTIMSPNIIHGANISDGITNAATIPAGNINAAIILGGKIIGVTPRGVICVECGVWQDASIITEVIGKHAN